MKHLLWAHGKLHWHSKCRKVLDEAWHEPVLYWTSVPGDRQVACPVELCDGRASTRDRMRQHFCFCHPRDIILIEEEGHGALPRCSRCDMFVLAVALCSTHPGTKRCQEGADQKRKQHLELENLIMQETVFTVNGIPLESMDCFKYLGRIVTVNDSVTPAVMSNLCKAHGHWAQVSHILPLPRSQLCSTRLSCNQCYCLVVRHGWSQMRLQGRLMAFTTI